MKILAQSLTLVLIIALISPNPLSLNITSNSFYLASGDALKTVSGLVISSTDGKEMQSMNSPLSSKHSSSSTPNSGKNGGEEQKDKLIPGLLNKATLAVKDNNIGKAISLLDQVLFNLENNITDMKPFSNFSVAALISNGATVSGRPLKALDDLPPAQVVSSEVQVTAESTPATIEFKIKVKPGFDPAEIYEGGLLPTYPLPNVSKSFTYMPPAFRIMQEADEDDRKINENYILATPIINHVQTNMNILIDNSNSSKENQSSLQQVRLIPIKNSSNVGFSIAVADNIPDVLKISPPPVNELALFLETGIVSRTEKLSSYLNSELTRDNSGISNSNSTLAEDPSILLPEFRILASKSLNSAKLLDGCPDINFLYLNETIGSWNPAPKPLREMSMDTFDKCGYVLKPEHNSKFAVGGVQPLL